jgi:hypothetical protein
MPNMLELGSEVMSWMLPTPDTEIFYMVLLISKKLSDFGNSLRLLHRAKTHVNKMLWVNIELIKISNVVGGRANWCYLIIPNEAGYDEDTHKMNSVWIGITYINMWIWERI